MLTATGLSPSGSCTAHIFSQHMHRTAQLILEEYGPCTIFCELYPGICVTTEEKSWKNLSQGSQRVPVDTIKTEIQNRTFVTIRKHKHNNKNMSQN